VYQLCAHDERFHTIMTLIFLLYFLYSFSFVLIKESLFFAQPFFLAAERLLLAGGLIIVYYRFYHKKKIIIAAKDYWLFGLASVFSVFLTNCLDLWALQYLYAAKVALIYTLAPFWGALLTAIFFGEYLSRSKWFGLLIGFGGIFPFILSGKMGAFSYVDGAILFASFATVLGWTAIKKLVDDRSYSPIIVNGVTLFIGGVFSLILSFATESWRPVPTSNILYSSVFVIATAFVAHIISYNLYGFLLRRYSVVFMTLASLSMPLFTALLGYLFLLEKVPETFFISLVILSIGLYIFYRDDLRAPHVARSKDNHDT
jgi:drug/metabolite transporter (DMT)-like permease